VMKNLERAAEPLESLITGPPVVDNPVVDDPVVDDQFVKTPLVAGPLTGSPIEAPVARPVEATHVADPVLLDPQAGSEAASVPDRSDHEQPAEAVSSGSGRRVDFVAWALSAAVLACTLLLVVLIAQRFGAQRAGAQRLGSTRVTTNRHAVQPTSAAISTATSGATASGGTGSGATAPNPKGASIPGVSVAGASAAPASTTTAVSRARSAPPGSLVVFENGKEVFRMPPSQDQAEAPAAADGAVERAASVAPDRVVALSPAAAESSLIHRVEPDYPEAARSRQLQGAVVLDVHIGQDGTVQDLKLVSGEPLLADAAMAAVRQWRFQPRSIDGAPAEMQTKVTLKFRLSN
jgi:TonB family protein